MAASTNTSRKTAYNIGAVLALVAVVILLLPGNARWYSGGPANTGHESLGCGDCHTPAPGTVRQQLQANARHLLGLRDHWADFVYRAVGNTDCLACHRNEDDKHPVYRFNEPRFKDARAAITPQQCVSCHREHAGRRVTVGSAFCSHCHGELTLRDDPITPAHDELTRTEQWTSCLRCHDYHGNHLRKTPVVLPEQITEQSVKGYFSGGVSPYGEQLRFPASNTREVIR